MGSDDRIRRKGLLVAVAILMLAGCGHMERKLEGDTGMGMEWLEGTGVLGTWPLDKTTLTCHGKDKMYLGHAYENTYWPEEPTCLAGGTYHTTCARCGYLGETGEDAALPHLPVARKEIQGDCIHSTVEVTDCEMCGLELGRRSYFVEEHDFQESYCQVFDTVTLNWEQKNCMKCRRCGVLQ